MSQSAILILHDGNQDYLNKCVLQAQKNCNRVKFIGKSELFESELKNEDLKNAEKSINLFLSFYKHMSTNPERIEISCFKRFFYAYEYAKINSLADIWIIDSDVMIYTNLIEISEKGRWLELYDAGLSIQNQEYASYDWAASPHTSWWKTEKLKNFLEFIVDTYKNNISTLEEKYNFNRTEESRGGVCDMTLLYLWSLNKKILNFANEFAGEYCIDHNINQTKIPNNFIVKMRYGIKRVFYDDDIIKLETNNNKRIKVGTLHFQGRAKNFMGKIDPGFKNSIICILIVIKLKIYNLIKK